VITGKLALEENIAQGKADAVKTDAVKTDDTKTSPSKSADPFGKDIKPPAAAKAKVDSGTTAAAKAAPPKPPADPQLIKLYLQNGSTISGRLTIKQITIETRFGTLLIPIERIKSITPGLGSNSGLGAKVNALIEKLGSDVFGDREAAEKELLGFGLPVRNVLKGRLGGSNDERQRRLKKLLAVLEEMASEQEDEFEPSEAIWIERDTVETTKFTVYGSISPKSFQVESKYGLLTVKLGDIRNATRDFDVSPIVRRQLSVDQTNLVHRGYKSSGIRVEKGDLITIAADGTLTMTPWGSNYSSTPDGLARSGNYKPNILMGSLLAKIGSGSEMKIGRESRFTAKTSGVLQFAIAISQNYTSNQFPGSYNIRIKVEKPAK
jgi:hypothetical protein